mmetsp:Transcript_87230/g.154524  ORF Transcript_87230/g.154524 Transcript_87230/m.154524 type:complete len:239 (+) Transcript_87230:47-763(+)
MSWEEPVENVPRPVPKITDVVDKNSLPFVKRTFTVKAPSQSREYNVTLRTDLSKSGYNMMFQSNAAVNLCVVAYVGEGAGSKWNAAYADRQIKPNDRLLDVNGITEVNKMLDEMRSAEEVIIQLRRPLKFQVTVQKDGRALGIALIQFDNETLWVDQIADSSIIHQWNMGNPFNQVLRGTRILEVNGQGGSLEALREALKQAEGRIDMIVESHGAETANPEEPAHQNLRAPPVKMPDL